MAIVIIDNFSGYHGNCVKNSTEKYYDGKIYTINLAKNRVSMDTLETKLDFVYDQITNEEWKDITAVNLSFGGGITTDFTWAEEDGWEDYVQPLWNEDVDVFFPSGNYGRQNYPGVSEISSSPFSWSIGAMDEKGDEIADYTQWDPKLTSAFVSGYNETYDVKGTSFASPTIAAAISTVREEHDLNILEARTAFEATADYETGSDYIFGEGWQSFIYQKINIDKLQQIDGKINISEVQWTDAAYEIFCGRQPDEAGLEYWSDKFQFEEINTNILKDFINSASENDDILADAVPLFERVQAHYHLFLNREADMPGLEYWIDKWTSKEYTSWENFSKDFLAAASTNEQIQFQGIQDDFWNEITLSA